MPFGPPILRGGGAALCKASPLPLLEQLHHAACVLIAVGQHGLGRLLENVELDKLRVLLGHIRVANPALRIRKILHRLDEVLLIVLQAVLQRAVLAPDRRYPVGGRFLIAP